MLNQEDDASGVAQTTPQRDLSDPATRAALAADARARHATAMIREVGLATYASGGDVASASSGSQDRAPLSAAMDVGHSDPVLGNGAMDGAAAGDARRASSVSIAGTPRPENEAWGEPATEPEPEAEGDSSSDELFGEDTADGVWRATYPAPPRAPPAPAPAHRGSSVEFSGLFDESAEYESDE